MKKNAPQKPNKSKKKEGGEIPSSALNDMNHERDVGLSPAASSRRDLNPYDKRDVDEDKK